MARRRGEEAWRGGVVFEGEKDLTTREMDPGVEEGGLTRKKEGVI